MGNYAYKKEEAAEFNANRKHRLEQEEKLRLDKINNPEKHQRKRRGRINKAQLFVAAAAWLGVSSLQHRN